MSGSHFSAIGVDLGDRNCVLCGLDDAGGVGLRETVRTSPESLQNRFAEIKPTTVAIEAGPLSAWVSRMLETCGHGVIVANPRKLHLISANSKKTDRADAELLARLARSDPKLLCPIQHRGEKAQAHLAAIRSRDLLVRTRAQMINHVRSIVKGFGVQLPSCSASAFHTRSVKYIPPALFPAVRFVLDQIASTTDKIKAYDKLVERLVEKQYPDAQRLRQVTGVGALTALSFLLTIEDPNRFSKSRQVGAYFGLCSRSHDSSESRPQLRISKEGNGYVRRLLVGSAHYILGPFGPPCSLREWGQRLMQRGGKNAKKRAAVAVARRLAVLLHRLWVSGEKYDPWRNVKRRNCEEVDKAA